MDTWTKQMGYPVVTISNNNGQTATVTQTRFLQNPLSEGELMAPSPYKLVI